MKLGKLSALACFNLSFHWFSIGLVIPVMTLFLIEKGFSLIQVGLAFAVYSGTTVVLELPTGGLADSIGRKKVYLCSLLLQLIGGIALVLVQGFIGVLVCFIFHGASRSLASGTMDAHFIDEFYRCDPEIDLQREMARIGVFSSIALGVGSLLGGVIPMTLGKLTEGSFLQSIYASNYLVFSLVIAIQFVLTSLLVREESRDSRRENKGAIIGRVSKVLADSVTLGLKNPVICILLFAGFAWGFSISGLENLWQPRVRTIVGDSVGTWIYGLLTCGYFLADALGGLLVTRLCRIFRNDYSRLLFFARLVMGALFFILAFQNGVVMFSILYITLFVFNGLQGSPESALFNSEVPSEKRSTMLSFSSLFLQSGGILGSVVMGALAHHFSIKIAWIVGSVVIATSALLYLIIPSAMKTSAEGKNAAAGSEHEL